MRLSAGSARRRPGHRRVKAVSEVSALHKAQLLSYLRLTEKPAWIASQLPRPLAQARHTSNYRLTHSDDSRTPELRVFFLRAKRRKMLKEVTVIGPCQPASAKKIRGKSTDDACGSGYFGRFTPRRSTKKTLSYGHHSFNGEAVLSSTSTAASAACRRFAGRHGYTAPI